ncbi:MAG: hypothetical protein WDO13_14840 [Verrucomicrobiota bacterium]
MAGLRVLVTGRRWLVAGWFSLGGCALAADSGAPPATAPASPAPGQVIRDDAIGFTVTVPGDWQVKQPPHGRYPVAYGPSSNGILSNLDVETERFAGPLGDYVDANLAMVRENFDATKVLSRQDFAGAAGVQGVKIVMSDIQFNTSLLQVFYFFPAANHAFVILTGTEAQGAPDATGSAFDAMARTFALTAPSSAAPPAHL